MTADAVRSWKERKKGREEDEKVYGVEEIYDDKRKGKNAGWKEGRKESIIVARATKTIHCRRQEYTSAE